MGHTGPLMDVNGSMDVNGHMVGHITGIPLKDSPNKPLH